MLTHRFTRRAGVPVCCRAVTAFLIAASSLAIVGCASPQASSGASAEQASGSALAYASHEPVAESHAAIAVAGLACPKCASNVDVQLQRIPGVHVENIDMRHGRVMVRFDRTPHPSPAQLGRAVEAAGLTFLGVGPAAALPPNMPVIEPLPMTPSPRGA
ncbi:MAG: heavy-metal-associated domain-containing protein [Phycisphaeraceae bacterium]|nr:heavy-metal-associated domain-containing protein [Phycisphaeraceae bacterium]